MTIARNFSASALTLAIFAGLSAGAIASQPGSSASARTQGAPSQQGPAATDSGKAQVSARQRLASRIVGMNVRGAQGTNIGQLEDLAIDLKTGEVRYAMLEFDRGFLSGGRVVPVPLSHLRLGPDENSLVYQSANRQKLEASAMSQSQWNDLVRNADRLTQVDRGWGLQPLRGAQMIRANDLLDKEVQDRSGEHIGEIEDLVIDMERQKVRYAMLEFERSWIRPEKTVAVPLTSFMKPVGGDEITLDIAKDKVAGMTGLTREQMRRPADPEVIAVVERQLVFLQPASRSATSDTQGTRASGAGPANKEEPRK